MADPAEVERLLGLSLAAHRRYRVAANAGIRQDAARGIRDALAAILAALALDPGRTTAPWRQGDTRTQIALSDRMILYYQQYAADATAAGF